MRKLKENLDRLVGVEPSIIVYETPKLNKKRERWEQGRRKSV